MKEKTALTIAAALFLLWYWKRGSASGITTLPLNQTPAQQAIYNALIPSVDAYGNIINPTDVPPLTDVNSKIVGWTTIDPSQALSF